MNKIIIGYGMMVFLCSFFIYGFFIQQEVEHNSPDEVARTITVQQYPSAERQDIIIPSDSSFSTSTDTLFQEDTSDNTEPLLGETSPGSKVPRTIIVDPALLQPPVPALSTQIPPTTEVTQTNAPCVYNHAYQENYKNDSITQILNEAKDCYVLIDPYEDNAYKQITTLQSKGNVVGCYISVGTGEDWRSDFGVLKPYLAENAWGEWEGEYFVSETSPELLNIMKARIATLSAWGCDYVEFDNMDWAFDDDNIDEYNLQVTYDEAVTYNQTLCSYVHSKNMKCMAKNTREGAVMFDGGTYESYPNEQNWWDVSGLKAFLSETKLGIIVHYNERKCDAVYEDYRAQYGEKFSFICEDKNTKQYTHYK